MNYYPLPALICAAAALSCAPLVFADHDAIDLIEVYGKHDVREFELAETVDIGPDSAALLRKAPGGDVNSNGPLTGIAQYRGMFGNRIAVQVNGTTLSAGGPNWMDPPLSYAPSALLESLVVYRGIAPVSAGQETLGGVINATTWSGEFSNGGFDLGGRVRAGAQSANAANLVSGMLVLANANHRFKASVFTESADDAEFASGEILPTRFERDRYDIGYGFRSGNHTLQFDYGRNETGDTGTPALPMDIEYIDSDLYSIRSDYRTDLLALQTRLYGSNIRHGMTNFHLRPAGNAAMWRRNVATGDNAGFAVAAEIGTWRVGVDGHEETHNSDISNPNNAVFFVTNFNEAKRRVLGVFAEHTVSVGADWDIEAGLRVNRVSMDAEEVDGTPARMMPPAMALRDAFNAADRSQSDTNVDWVIKAHYQRSDATRLYAGVSRKTRSPSYQERFLWLPLEATGGLADMRTYTGNLNLDPEVSHEIELGFDTRQESLSIAPRIFYRRVNDYIQGTVSDNAAAVMFVNMMNTVNGTGMPAPLQFNNVRASLYGADVDWRYALSNRWSLNGVLSYVRGTRDDIDDNLYRISPLHAFVTVSYDASNWGLSLESQLYDGQDRVSASNGELATPGYALLNLAGHWIGGESLRIGFGVDNLADREYASHLGGYNRVMLNPAVGVGERLPGYGRNAYLRIDYAW